MVPVWLLRPQSMTLSSRILLAHWHVCGRRALSSLTRMYYLTESLYLRRFTAGLSRLRTIRQSSGYSGRGACTP